MALQLADVISATRGRHPSFEKRNVPDATLARFLTGYQRSLVSRAVRIFPSFLAQQCSVGFDVSPNNAVGTAGVGTAGGLPVRVTNGTPAIESAPVGSAAEIDVDEDAQVFQAEVRATAATASTISYSGAAWTTNEHDGRLVVIVAGRGAGQRREIASNTATQLTVTQDWATVPDTTSVFKVVVEVIEDENAFGAVAGESFLAERLGYLVRLSATGVAYLDLTRPLVAKFAVGIPLPAHHALLGGTVRFTDDDEGCELGLVGYSQRFGAREDFAAYVQNGELYLLGEGADWGGVTSIDLRYVPVPPALSTLADYLLLPDSCYQVLADGAAHHAAVRVQGLEGVPRMNVGEFAGQRRESEDLWLAEIGAQKRRQFTRKRGW